MLPHSYALVEQPSYTVDEWLEAYTKHFGHFGGLVGIKQTCLSLLTRGHWEALSPRLVIRTWRAKEPTVASMMRWRQPKDEEFWSSFYDRREKAMQENLDWGHGFPVVRVVFTDKAMSVSEALEPLRRIVGRLA